MRYRVYCDTTLISDSYIPDSSMHLVSPKLKTGVSIAGTFEFTVSKVNPGYSKIKRMTTVIIIMEDDDIIWTGRVVSESEDFWKRRTFTCEGALSFLNDTLTVSNYASNLSSESSVDEVVYGSDEDGGGAYLEGEVSSAISSGAAWDDSIIGSSNNSSILDGEVSISAGANNSSSQAVSSDDDISSWDVRTFLYNVLEMHNSKIDITKSNQKFKKIVLGNVDVADGMDHSYEYVLEDESVFESIKKNVLDRINCYILIRYSGTPFNYTTYLDCYDDYLPELEQNITFGDNLLDFTKKWSLSELVTVIYPRGKQDTEEGESDKKQYLTIEEASSNNTHSKYIQADQAVNKYGIIEKVVDFPDVEDPNILFELGTIYLKSQQFDEMVLEISAVDLKNLGLSESKFKLLHKIKVYSKPHGLEKYFPIFNIEYDLEVPSQNKYTLSLTSSNNRISTSIKTSVEQVNDKLISWPNPLEEAKTAASDFLNRRTTGYVNIVEENEHSQALIISKTLDWQTPGSTYWRFNMNGLGFTKRAVNGVPQFDLAITMDGTIVADRIKTGILSDGATLANSKNYWNLQTGEFSLSSTVKIKNGSKTKSLGDVYDMANDITDLMNSGSGENIVPNSGNFSRWRLSPSKDYWIVTPNNNYGLIKQKTALNNTQVTGTKGYIRTPLPISTMRYNNLAGKKYVLSFEIAGTDYYGEKTTNNQAYVVLTLEDAAGYQLATKSYASMPNPYNKDFKKIVIKFNMVDSTFTRCTYNGTKLSKNSSKKYTGKFSNDGVYFGFRIVNKSKKLIAIRNIKLEEGVSATGWSMATTDVIESYNEAIKASNTYTDSISTKDRSFSKSQVNALNTSLNQAAILKKLTNNYKSKGIYLKSGQLYMNASYIKSGTVSAGIIEGGILTNNVADTAGGKNSFYWNLKTGYIKTKNMQAVNINADGTVTSGSSARRVKIHDGCLTFYKYDSAVNRIQGVSVYMKRLSGVRGEAPGIGRGSVGGFMGKSQYINGIGIASKSGIFLSAPRVIVAKSDNINNDEWAETFTGRVSFTWVEPPTSTMGMYINKFGLEFVNGLLVNPFAPGGPVGNNI